MTIPRARLVAQIAAIAEQIDRHYGDPPGPALPAIYSHYWPAADCDTATLKTLLRDARSILANLDAGTAPEPGDPCTVCAHPLENPGEALRGVCRRCLDTLTDLHTRLHCPDCDSRVAIVAAEGEPTHAYVSHDDDCPQWRAMNRNGKDTA